MIPMRPVLIAALLVAATLPAAADTFVVPHLLDTPGSLVQAPGTFDTTLYAMYTNDLGCAPGGNDGFLTVYIYDSYGNATLGGSGLPVCEPCMFPIGPSNPYLGISVVDLFMAAGGFLPVTTDAHMVVETSGAAAPDITVAYEIRAHVDSQALPASTLVPLRPLVTDGGGSCKTLVFSHLLETSGDVTSGGNTIDTTFYLTYTPEFGVPGEGADVSIYLFDEATGGFLTDNTGTTICGPCNFPMGIDSKDISPRKRKISVESMITAQGGGFPSDVVFGYAIVVVNGDADLVNITSSVVNARSGPGDLAVFVFEPQAITAAAAVSAEDVARLGASLRTHPNPFNPRTTLDFVLPREDRVQVRVLDMRGRVVRELMSARLPAGDHTVVWDGRDNDGRELPSRVYRCEDDHTETGGAG